MKHLVLLSFFLWFGSGVSGQTNSVYRIQKGDTLTRVAARHHVSLSELIRINQIDPRSVLKIGQPLLIPSQANKVEPIGSIIQPVSRTNTLLITNQNIATATNLYHPPPTLQINSNFFTNKADQVSSITNRDKPSSRSAVPSTGVTSPPSSSLIYIVQPGDNLFKIGKRHRVTPEQIAQWNGMSLKSVLKIGQRLKINPSEVPTEKPLPVIEPLVLEKPKPPESSPVIAPKPAVTNVIPVAIKTNLSEQPPVKEPIIKVGEVVKPVPKPIAKPISKLEPPPPSKPQPSPKKEEVTPSQSSSSYVFLQRVKAKIDQPKVKRGRWKYIVIHHSGTKQGNAQIFETYHRKVKRMENGLAYHFVIGNGTSSRDGEIEIGGRWAKQLQGGHLYSEYLNSIAIGICFVGDFSKQKPTAKQIAACIELVEYLKKISYSPKLKFCLHREINPRPTDCPGDRFPASLLHRRLD